MSSGRKFSGEFKLKVALAAMNEDKTMAELCKEFNVHKSLINKWKKQVKDGGKNIFEGNDKTNVELDRLNYEIKELRAKVGELIMERDFLKKKLDL